jgi:nitroreductase
MEAAQKSPSASNRQARKFILVTDEKLKKQLAEAANNQSFIAEAAVVIVGIALEPERLMPCGINSSIVDVVIAMDHITLAAVEEGLGTCWIGAFSQKAVHDLLNIPDEYSVIELMPLGYPSTSKTSRPRKPLEELFCINQYTD